MTIRIAKLVCFGDGGDTVECGNRCHISGYGSPERPHAAEPKGDLIIPDGTPVIDKRPAVATEEGFSWVFRGPMVDVDLADGDCDACPQPSPIFAGAILESGNGFAPLLAQHAVSRARGEARSGLDHVSTREYVEGWRNVGAHIGHYQGGAIVWDN